MEHQSLPLPPQERELLRRAARFGPGYKGEKIEPTLRERLDLAKEFSQSGMAIPEYIETPVQWIRRSAKLFEAGDYPDKGISVTEADLGRLVEGFDLPVPLLIEHSNSPLQMGYLVEVEARGKELFGTVALTEAAHEFLQKTQADRLSIGLSNDLNSIIEVSLVRNPRVADARMFSGELSPEPRPKADIEQKIAGWIQRGKMLPSQASAVRRLFQFAATIHFDRKESLDHALEAFMEAQPAHALFRQMAPSQTDGSQHLLIPEEIEFYQKYFPEVSLDEIAQRKPRKTAQ